MATKVWWCAIVLILIQQVFARDCSDIESILNCNECIRCGGHWCNNPDKDTSRCTSERTDNWCPNGRETTIAIKELNVTGDIVNPAYIERTVNVGVPSRTSFVIASSVEPQVSVTILNTTQNFDFKVTRKSKCKDGICVIEAIPGKDFCSPTGRTSEFVNVKVDVEGVKEEILMKYHVPCACSCSEHVEKNSDRCNGRGDLSCGVCFCRNGWDGEFCEKKVCEAKRGDLQCTNPAKNDVECSGNGYCGPCETCVCYTDRVGSQYFEPIYCADICMVTNECDECLRNRTIGRCVECQYPHIEFRAYNESLMGERDSYNRNVWVRCNETLPDGCYVEYAAMRDDDDETYVMVIVDSCKAVVAEYGGAVTVTVPVVLGVLAIVAAAAAVTGFMMWKNKPPPLPLTDPQYQNIDAEDCTGENPLYKPPTSSFKNPAYGKKW